MMTPSRLRPVWFETVTVHVKKIRESNRDAERSVLGQADVTIGE